MRCQPQVSRSPSDGVVWRCAGRSHPHHRVNSCRCRLRPQDVSERHPEIRRIEPEVCRAEEVRHGLEHPASPFHHQGRASDPRTQLTSRPSSRRQGTRLPFFSRSHNRRTIIGITVLPAKGQPPIPSPRRRWRQTRGWDFPGQLGSSCL